MIQSSFIDQDFSKLMFKVRTIPLERSLLRAFPELGKHPEFKVKFDNINKDKLIRYVIYMYDRNTPLRRKFPDILRRKVEAAKEAGFKINEVGLFEDDVEEFLRGKNDKANRMIVAYARIHKNFKYSFFITIEESFYGLMRSVIGGELKNIPDLKKAQKELDESMDELLSGDKNPFLVEEVLRYMETERLALRPEDIARKLKNDEPAATNPDVSGD